MLIGGTLVSAASGRHRDDESLVTEEFIAVPDADVADVDATVEGRLFRAMRLGAGSALVSASGAVAELAQILEPNASLGRDLRLTLREPFGVVGRIIPLNHPLMFAAAKIAAPVLVPACCRSW